MKYFLCLVVLAVCAYAQASVPPEYAEKHSLSLLSKKMSRHPRDISWDKKVGDNGKVFGALGQDDSGLFGKAGYDHQFFNDDRGKLNAQAYGSRVLGPYGDTTNFGGKLDWADQNARAGIDLSKSIGGHTGLKATGEGVWNLDKDTHVSAGGFYQQEHLGHGRSDYGVQAEIKKYF